MLNISVLLEPSLCADDVAALLINAVSLRLRRHSGPIIDQIYMKDVYKLLIGRIITNPCDSNDYVTINSRGLSSVYIPFVVTNTSAFDKSYSAVITDKTQIVFEDMFKGHQLYDISHYISPIPFMNHSLSLFSLDHCYSRFIQTTSDFIRRYDKSIQYNNTESIAPHIVVNDRVSSVSDKCVLLMSPVHADVAAICHAIFTQHKSSLPILHIRAHLLFSQENNNAIIQAFQQSINCAVALRPCILLIDDLELIAPAIKTARYEANPGLYTKLTQVQSHILLIYAITHNFSYFLRVICRIYVDINGFSDLHTSAAARPIRPGDRRCHC